jgi:uncharacterized membrane protein YozB (DUF420 family)
MENLQKNILVSLVLGLLFFLVSSSYTYELTNKTGLGVFFEDKCQTGLGHIVHTLVFFLLVLGFMMLRNWMVSENKSVLLLAKYAITSALVFFIISSTEVYAVVNQLIPVSNNSGCPTMMGVGVHTVVYTLLVFGLMFLPKDN